MAEIKINKLMTEKSLEMIDLRSEAAEGNLAAFTAFTSLRGGAKAIWCIVCFNIQ